MDRTGGGHQSQHHHAQHQHHKQQGEHHELHDDRPSTASFNNHKETIAGFESELKSARALLLIQQQESRQSQEHIELLNREVDALRFIIDDKQQEIQKLNIKLESKKEKVNEFENTFDQFRIDHLAFYELEQQNSQLLERLKEKQKAIDELEIEAKYLRNQKDDSMMIDERKVKKLAELEIVMPIERSQMEAKITQSSLTIQELQSRVLLLEEENSSLKHMMEWNNELKLDQLARSKQAEYRMLMQLDQRDEEQRALEEDKAALQKTAEVQAQRGNEIQRQWRKSVEKLDNVENMCGAIVDYVERDYGRAITAEKLLLKENQKLQAQSQVLREIVSRASTREGMMELSQSLTFPSPSKFNQFAEDTSWQQSSPVSERILSPKQKLLPIDAAKDNQSKKLLSSTAPSMLQPKNKPVKSQDTRPQTTMMHKPTKNAQHSTSELTMSTSTKDPLLSVSTSFAAENKQDDLHSLISPEFINPQQTLEAEEVKANCIAKYMLLICTCTRYISEILLMQKDYKILTYGSVDAEMSPLDVPPVLAFMREVRLNQFHLVDSDIDYIIDWLRTISSEFLNVIDLQQNSLTSEGLFKLVAWMLSWTMEEVKNRPQLLELDLRGNEIEDETFATVIDLLKTRLEFAHAGMIAEEDNCLCVFARTKYIPVSTTHSRYSMIVKINLNNQNKVKVNTRGRIKKKFEVDISRAASSSISTAFPSPAKLPPWKAEIQKTEFDVYPRNSIMKPALE